MKLDEKQNARRWFWRGNSDAFNDNALTFDLHSVGVSGSGTFDIDTIYRLRMMGAKKSRTL